MSRRKYLSHAAPFSCTGLIACGASGNIQTPLLDQALEIQGGGIDMAHAIRRVGTADEVAQLTLFLLSDASQYVTGAVYNIDGGWN